MRTSVADMAKVETQYRQIEVPLMSSESFNVVLLSFKMLMKKTIIYLVTYTKLIRYCNEPQAFSMNHESFFKI